MRLTEDQVRQALQTLDKDVRFAALQYFARSYSKNPTIMPDVIGLVESLGPKDAFRYSFPISDLAQTDETITWAVNWLQREPTAEEEDFLSHIGRLLCHADPMLILPHKAAILSSPGLDRQLASAHRTSAWACLDAQRPALATARSDLRSGQGQNAPQ